MQALARKLVKSVPILKRWSYPLYSEIILWTSLTLTQQTHRSNVAIVFELTINFSLPLCLPSLPYTTCPRAYIPLSAVLQSHSFWSILVTLAESVFSHTFPSRSTHGQPLLEYPCPLCGHLFLAVVAVHLRRKASIFLWVLFCIYIGKF